MKCPIILSRPSLLYQLQKSQKPMVGTPGALRMSRPRAATVLSRRLMMTIYDKTPASQAQITEAMVGAMLK
jgi:hypothetical protein